MSALPELWHQRFSPLQQRIISAVILSSIVFGAIILGGWLLSALIAVMAVLAYREYLPLVQKTWHKSLEYIAYISLSAGCILGGVTDVTLGLVPVLVGFVVLVILSHLLPKQDGVPRNAVRLYAGLFYVAVPALSILWLRQIGGMLIPSMPWFLLLMPILGVWATDTGAYFSGRKFGGPKIAPKISPNKTWAGLIGGMIAAALVVGFMAIYAGLGYAALYFLVGAVLAVIAQIGDFFESHLKRKAGVKDSGSIIPGHGGILDRIDGILTALPFFAALVLILL